MNHNNDSGPPASSEGEEGRLSNMSLRPLTTPSERAVTTTDDDNWSRYVEADVSERGPMSNASTTMSVLDDDDDDDEREHEQHTAKGMDALDSDEEDHHSHHFINNNHPADNDEDDNWSRQVEADDIFLVPSSVMDDEVEQDHSSSRSPRRAMLPHHHRHHDEHDDDEDPSNDSHHEPDGVAGTSGVAPPKRDEPTLKEKLVERERQRRAETERARLTRQFALRSAANEEGDGEYDGDEHEVLRLGGHMDGQEGDDDGAHEDEENGHDPRENGSVAGTVGEGSIVAPVDVLMEDDAHKQANYQMERFLQGTILEEETSREPALSSKRDPQNQGVVMERFLQEPVVVEASPDAERGEDQPRSTVDRSVSFDMEPPASQSSMLGSLEVMTPIHLLPSSVGGRSIHEEVATPPATPRSFPSFDNSQVDAFINASVDVGTSIGAVSLGNASMDCLTSEAPRISDLAGDGSGTQNAARTEDEEDMGRPSTPLIVREVDTSSMPPESPSTDQPRLLGLTLAEIEEMAAIEEVSQQNAPPSERDDLSASSFVGELLNDFGGPGAMMDHHGGGTTLSQGTPTTAMESASILSGNQSAPPTVSDNADDDHRSIDVLGSVGGGVSIMANPPSELGNEDALLSSLPGLRNTLESDRDERLRASTPSHNMDEPGISIPPIISHVPPPDELSELATLNAGVVNRQIRPGMLNLQQLRQLNHGIVDIPASPVRRVMSVPDKMHFDLDGFDYDKNVPLSPAGSGGEHVDDIWSPGSKMSFERSPFRSHIVQDAGGAPLQPTRLNINYGATENTKSNVGSGLVNDKSPLQHRFARMDQRHPTRATNSETEPLMPDIPSEITAKRQSSRVSLLFSSDTMNNINDNNGIAVRSMADNAFREIRYRKDSMAPANQNDEVKESHHISIWQRALSTRLLVLVVTLVLEIPVLLMVAGGSDRLCGLVGRSKYQLLMGLLPVGSAISGNIGLQASTLTTHAIVHGHVTNINYTGWLIKEVGVALILGLAMGSFVGAVSFVMSGWSVAFGSTVGIAQFLSNLTAGLTGALSPFLLGVAFERDANNWCSPLVTIIQDIVGTFAMVVLTYKMLELFGPLEVSQSDICSVLTSDIVP